MIIETLDTGEVAHILRLSLGTVRTNWSDFLSDCVRGKTSLCGRTLKPIARVKTPGDHCKRPRYEVAAVKNFITEYLHDHTVTALDRALKKITIEIDPDMLALPMSMRRATAA